jgi:hypothetical protein
MDQVMSGSIPPKQFDRRQVVTSGVAAATAMAAPLIFSSSAQGQDRLVIDAIGLHTRLARPAERVVITSHHNYEDFTAIAGPDAWARVVGFAREPWQDWRAADSALRRAFAAPTDSPEPGHYRP